VDLFTKVLLPLLFLLVSGLAAMKGKGAGAKKSEEAEDPERTRRVKEEIRRKIAERRDNLPPVSAEPAGKPVASPIAAPRPVAGPPTLGDFLSRGYRALLEEKTPAPAPQRPAPASEPPHASPIYSAASPASPSSAPTSHNWLAELRDPATVRRAILLREILGTPVGLR
jgi:hypothetical protein